MRDLLLFVAATLAAPAQIASQPSQPLNAAAQAIDADRVRQHVKFLSHDLLEGRGTGQRGGDIAAEFIATQFALYGLKPGGDKGSYKQQVPLVGVTTDPRSTFTLAPANGAPMPLKFKDEWVAYNETLTESADINAEMVYVGYGIEAPEYEWDDYKGADVRGKVLLMLVNEPPSKDDDFFKGRALTYYGRWTYKYEQAGRKGAAGVVLIHQTEMASYGWDVVRNSNSGERAFIRDRDPHVKSAGWIQLEVARKLLAASDLDLDKLMEEAKSRDFKPRPVGARLEAKLLSKVREMQSSNVIGILPGSDPKLRDEAVIYSGHYDHLGIRQEMPGDNIFNGAVDNATGIAALLEMARMFAEAPRKPRRSIVFAAVTAEEQGLRGSEYLGQHSPIPPGKITLGLNYDAISPIGVPEEVEVVGAERSSFYPVVQATANRFKLSIRPDSRPEAGHYYRSDHFSFARVGIPAFSIDNGVKWQGHPAEWGEAQAREYNEKRYHQPSDEYRPSMTFDSVVKLARFGVALGWQAANAPKLIEWVKGDEFEAARKQSQQPK